MAKRKEATVSHKWEKRDSKKKKTLKRSVY